MDLDRGVVPRPLRVTPGAGAVTLDATSTLFADAGALAVADWLRAALGPATGCWLPPADPSTATVTLAVDAGLLPASYRLVVSAERVRLTGGDAAGLHYGAQTLRQLLPADALRRARVGAGPWTVPAVVIDDAPRYAWRGLLLDVARHFLPVADVLRVIDLMALHKLNVLHLHLTDDQGWRLPVPAYPRLASVASWRVESPVGARRDAPGDGRPHGGCYTRDDLREIVAYAADRHVRVVPEVDMPGHMEAAIAAYPWLGVGGVPRAVRTRWGISPHVLAVTDEVLDFCRTVLDEVCDIFPDEVICVGGDECPTDEWVADPASRSRAASLGLAPERLQGWFMGELADHLASRGRRMLAWDEILDGPVPPGTIVAAWRDVAQVDRALRGGHDVVACPCTELYLDYRQSSSPDEPIPVGRELPLQRVYAYDPGPVYGVQANLWTEHVDSARSVDYQLFPRLCAVAELAWSPLSARDWADFDRRLSTHADRLSALSVESRPPDGPRPWQRRPDAPGRPS